jgi:hypothetical protein
VPLILTGPAAARDYFTQIDRFVAATLGPEARKLYQIIVDDPVAVARAVHAGVQQVAAFRTARTDAYYFNWALTIDRALQAPFAPTHANMRDLNLDQNQDRHLLAANLRRAFSGVVAGNVKDEGIRAVEQHGDFEIRGEAGILDALDALLASFVAQQRMKLPGKAYQPCYRIIK